MRQSTRLRTFVTTVSAATLALVLVGGMHALTAAAAPPTNNDWAPFGQANWVPGAGNPGFGLVTTGDIPSGTYGGIQLKSKYVPSAPDSITALQFDYVAAQPGPSVGSPRLAVQFSDGSYGFLRPVTLSTTWVTENGMTTATDWESHGGSCGDILGGTDWATVKACHAGDTITAIFVVNDSAGQVTLDNITVNNITATGPRGNQQ